MNLMTKINGIIGGGFEAGYATPPKNFDEPLSWITKTFPDRRSAKFWLESIAKENAHEMFEIYDEDGNVDYEAMNRAYKTYIDDMSASGHSQRVLHSAAGLDAMLKSMLLRVMEPLTKKLHDRLFEGYSPLNSFAAKIDLCFALKLIDPTTYSELQTVKNIRNAFAHPKGIPSFDTNEIRIECRKFLAYDADVADYFELYLRAVEEIVRTIRAI